ncbi:DUF1206 domain-containing protein [Telluribacter sp. SYSU D00476]|uniref:DUF1206 domain-containing protein n=1 Tax=Telluribacter sp. SYSU D00476 TaxID=2811430 RepID=UPI001FF406F2|nr:DUF1206 domain-containing protein [Telluribacter sp. SYSU D00476]
MKGRDKKRILIHYLPVYGCIATGIIYVAIGLIAILSYLKLKEGGADESSLLVFLDRYFLGKILNLVILLGTLCYIFWRIYETIYDPYNYGKGAKGLAKRAGVALSTTADALIAYAAIEVLLGIGNIPENGEPEEQRQLVGSILQESWGKWLIIGVGAIIALTAIVQFIYGVTRGYRERLDIDHFSSGTRRLIHTLAKIGYLARGIILGLIGFFFIKAGVWNSAYYIVNTDKAFDFIGDHVGHVYFILVALGTICYGLFMFALGVAYDVDRD